MSLVYVDDVKYKILDLSLDSFTILEYYKDSECNLQTSRLLGKYQKTINCSINKVRGIKRLHLRNMVESGDKKFEKAYEFDLCHDLLDSGMATVLSEKIEKNPDYDPEHWQELFDKGMEALIEAEDGDDNISYTISVTDTKL